MVHVRFSTNVMGARDMMAKQLTIPPAKAQRNRLQRNRTRRLPAFSILRLDEYSVMFIKRNHVLIGVRVQELGQKRGT